MLLISAAGLKFYGANFSPVPTMGVLSTPAVQNAVAAGELVLGAWLVSGRLYTAAWLTASVTFLVFAAVSGSLGLKGVADCGCFGAIQASPWIAFAVDMAAIGLLAIAVPNRVQLRADNHDGRLSRAASLAGGLAVVVALTGLGGHLVYGSAFAAVAKLRGEDLIYDRYLDFGSGQPGTPIERAVTITNLSDRPVTIVGGTADCSCVTHSDLPVTIAPYQTGTVTIQLRPPPVVGLMTRTCTLLTDSDRMPVLTVTLGVDPGVSSPKTED